MNFRGNLLGVAFQPGNPTRGYAVGEQGVLLSYGKTWTQEPESSIPAASPRRQLHLDRLLWLAGDRRLPQAP